MKFKKKDKYKKMDSIEYKLDSVSKRIFTKKERREFMKQFEKKIPIDVLNEFKKLDDEFYDHTDTLDDKYTLFEQNIIDKYYDYLSNPVGIEFLGLIPILKSNKKTEKLFQEANKKFMLKKKLKEYCNKFPDLYLHIWYRENTIED